MKFRYVSILVSAALFLPSCITAKESQTVERGFTEPSRFAGGLKPNPRTTTAPGRTLPQLAEIELQSQPVEMKRHAEKVFTFKLDKNAVLARLHAQVWHQGPYKKPEVYINGKQVTRLEPCWPSLAQRNYVFFLFDKEKEHEEVVDSYKSIINYQGWLEASCFIIGSLLLPEENSLTIKTTTDRIKIKDIGLEVLYNYDANDTIYDLRRKTRDLKLPLIK